jgi:SAM-dependent methyltransferase
MSVHLFAGLRVRNFDAAMPWYEQLLGEPTFFPHATEAVWTLAEDRSVYVVEHADGAGQSVVTIFLDDLDDQVAAIAGRGLEPDEQETYSGGVRKVLYRDPDGNEVGFGGARHPTSHERQAGQPWDASYLNGPTPWDIGRPQAAIVRLASEGAFAGAVLDAGCGTGENALHVAALGLSVLGVDVAETALSIAREKAAARGLDADFAFADALHLDRLDRAFDTVLDCGLFHSFDRDERRDYVASLAAVTRRGGNLYVLCFSDVGPADRRGPHPISKEELTAAFEAGSGWTVACVDPDQIQTRFSAEGAPAWLARLERR